MTSLLICGVNLFNSGAKQVFSDEQIEVNEFQEFELQIEQIVSFHATNACVIGVGVDVILLIFDGSEQRQKSQSFFFKKKFLKKSKMIEDSLVKIHFFLVKMMLLQDSLHIYQRNDQDLI